MHKYNLSSFTHPNNFTALPNSGNPSSSNPLLLPKPSSNVPVKRLSISELQEGWEKRLCYTCDEKFVSAHKSKANISLSTSKWWLNWHFSNWRWHSVINSISRTFLYCAHTKFCSVNTCNTPHKPTCYDRPLFSRNNRGATNIFRLKANFFHKEITVLVDRDSIHNFIQDNIVEFLNLNISDSNNFNVLVGNNDKLQCTSCYPNVPICFAETIFFIVCTCYL